MNLETVSNVKSMAFGDALPLHVPPATTSSRRSDARLLVLDRHSGQFHHSSLDRLADALRPGDLLVVNDAATLPASLQAIHEASGAAVELRLMACLELPSDTQTPQEPRGWQAVIFGAGDWRTKTEHRAAPPAIMAGDVFRFASGYTATAVSVRPDAPRLMVLEFAPCPHAGACTLHEIYQNGRPIQYAYHREALELWDHQTLFAASPVALEPPSSAIHLSWGTVGALRAKGVSVAPITHATGISSTGDPALDGLLPLPEQSYIPVKTAELITQTRSRGGRVIAQGTGVVRALEDAALAQERADTIASGSAHLTRLVATGVRIASLKLSPSHRLRVVDGILTGMHEADSSHLQLLGAFVSRETLLRAYTDALQVGYLWHEYGDVNLIL